MRRTRFAALALLIIAFAAAPCFAQSSSQASSPANESQLLKSTEVFLRNLFAWGPQFDVKLGPLAPSASPDFYTVPVRVTYTGQADEGTVYVSKDGKSLLRGDMFDTTADPFAADRAKIHLDGNPSKGPADARVTVVEYSDFQCPHCRELYVNLKTIEAEYPQVRFVFKDFPITQIHPWAETAAIGARCAFTQSPAAFWNLHNSIFDNQDVISAENVYEKLVEYASQAGLDADTFKACLASYAPKKAVEANRDEGIALGVNSTPSVYVNGRPAIGGDKNMIEQFIKFELAAHPK
ncbi:MAG: thioredoxin domain-containing protein [Candidatus Acidiferrales bacterium]